MNLRAAPIQPVTTDQDAADALLLTLADRVREARARRGMSRKILARDSRVSERYLAQLEAGKGNISILLLKQIAQALSMPLDSLLQRTDERSIDRMLIDQLLNRLSPQQLVTARANLARDFGQAHVTRQERIALIGLRGAGKSTLGARLARELDAPFIELDREVEREAATGLNEIFLLYGQAGYRRYERRALERLIEHHDRVVIATGGSIASEPGTFDLLLSTCFTVWLKARPEEHMARVIAQGDMRPIAGNKEAMDDLQRILVGRERLYRQADVAVDTGSSTIDQAYARLEQHVRHALAQRHALGESQ
ncbi:MAG: helix-turn-helix domain-containing protein [Betaproteobacteria bacterium]|nr:helix-turn-helix domain-containing protein [Betaproteobacteria bacterium]